VAGGAPAGAKFNEMDWLVMSTSASNTPYGCGSTMMEVSTSSAPAPNLNRVSPSLSASSMVLCASLASAAALYREPVSWYGESCSRSASRMAWVGSEYVCEG